VTRKKRKERRNHEMTYRKIALALWDLLDDIDTYSDMLKPDKSLFYMKVMNKVRKRFKYMGSDGYTVKRK
jgi:delta-aminolevulinic acid dehydratase/porphobilinogen synthase